MDKMDDVNNMELFLIVNNPDIAHFAVKCGVSRLFVDLEYMGKEQRQKGLNTWKSNQTAADVTTIKEAATGGHVMVRINPLFEGTKAEIDDVIARGADSVMLPMFRSSDELAQFLEILDGRAEAIPLIETASALKEIPNFGSQLPLTRVHIGLNDLHLDLGHRFMFEPIEKGLLEEAATIFKEHNIKFGIGGLARAGEGIISPEYLIGEHVRLGSDAAILSRTFHRCAEDLCDLKAKVDLFDEIEKLQALYRSFIKADPGLLEKNRVATVAKINDVLNLIEKSNRG